MFKQWRQSLEIFYSWYIAKQQATHFFNLKVFLIFSLLNLACYWLALLTTYPQLLASYKSEEYMLMGFPVALFGALFDCLSLYITLKLISHALQTTSNTRYIVLLSVDLFMAAFATAWVLFVFIASGWIVNLILDHPETIFERQTLYETRFWNAILHPFEPQNLKNIYFGMLMGASALLPTLFHLYLGVRSIFSAVFQVGFKARLRR